MKTRHIAISAFSIIVGFCTLYFMSSTTAPTGYADADEMTTAAHFGTVAHPPGYPLLTAIGHLYLSTTTPQNVAQATNLLSSIIQASSLCLFFLLAYIILSQIMTNTKKAALLGSLTATSILGLSYLFWLYGTTFEIASLTSILTVGTLLCAIRWHITPTKHWFLLTCVAFGALLSHYQLGIALGPGLLILFLARFKQYRRTQSKPFWTIPLGIILLLITFFAANSLLLLQNRSNDAISWNFDQNVAGWVGHIFRKDYAGFDPETNLSFNNSYVATPTIDKHTFMSLTQYIGLLSSHFGIVGSILALIGAIVLWRTHKILAASIITWFFVSGPGLAMYMRITALTFQPMLYLGVSERQYLMSEIVFALFIGVGATSIIKRCKSDKIRGKQYAPVILLIIAISCTGYGNRSLLTQKSTRLLASNMAQTRLAAAKPNALIICTNDIDCFTLFYYHLVEGKRSDVVVLSHMPTYLTNWLKQHPKYYPYANFDNPDYLAQLIAWNVSQRPVYLTNGINFFTEYIGLEAGPFYLTEANYLLEVSLTPPTTIKKDTSVFPIPSKNSLSHNDAYGKGIIETISTHQAYAGYLALRYGQSQTAAAFFHDALTSDPDNLQAQELLQGIDVYARDLLVSQKASSSAEYLTYARNQEKEGNMDQAYRAFRFGSYLAPTDTTTLSELANFLTRQGYPDQAATIEQHRLLFEK